jgi:hypothetical protein
MQLVRQALRGDIKAVAYLLANEPEIARAAERRLNANNITKNLTTKEVKDLYRRLVRGE